MSVHSKVVIFFSLLLIQPYQTCVLLQKLCLNGVKFREECFTLVPILFSYNILISVFLETDMENEGTRGLWQLPVFIFTGVEGMDFHFML